jgi:hypothetical protein
MGWWVIEDTELLRMMERCKDGEDPDLVYLEEYANSDHEDYRDAPEDD